MNSVPKEVKSQQLAEKKAAGKRVTGLDAPPAPTSTIDTYEKLLSSIPEFSGFGKLFKVISQDNALISISFMICLVMFSYLSSYKLVLSTSGADRS